MRKSGPSLRILYSFWLLTFMILPCLAGCGKLHEFFAPSAPEYPHFVTINWDPSKTPVAGYSVYRQFQQSGPIRLTPQIVTKTQYVDGSVQAGRTYTYYVTSVDSNGLESKPSEKIVVTVPAK